MGLFSSIGSFFTENAIPFVNKAIDFATGWIEHDRAKDTSKDLMNWQNANEIKFWEMNNAYNHPSQQMKRLQEAGINPNLAFSNGQLSNISASPKSASANAVQSPNFGSNSLMSYMLAQEQIKTQQSTQDLLAAQAGAQEAKAALDRAQAIKATSETYNINFWNQLNDENRKYHKERPFLDNELVAANVLNVTADTQLKQAQYDLAKSAESLNRQQITNLVKQLSLIDSEIQRNYAQTNLYNQQAKTEYQKEISQKLENRMKSIGLYPSDPTYARVLAMFKVSPNKGISFAIHTLEMLEKTNYNLNMMSNTYHNTVPSTLNAIGNIIP